MDLGDRSPSYLSISSVLARDFVKLRCVRHYMYSYIIRCVETLLWPYVSSYFFFSYIASIKYVYNNVTHLLLEFCSKYVVCTCESPFMRYRTHICALAIATGRFARATTPVATSFFAVDSISRYSRSSHDWKCARYRLHVARKSHNRAKVRRCASTIWFDM